MQITRWDTSQVEPDRQFDFYRSGLCSSFAHLTPETDQRDGQFSASIQTWSLEGRAMTRMSADNHRVARTRRDLRLVEDDNIYLNYVVSGSMRFEQKSQRVELQSKGMILLDNALPFECEIAPVLFHDHIAVRIPRTCFRTRSIPDAEELYRHPVSAFLEVHLGFIAAHTSKIDGIVLAAAIEGIEKLCGYFGRRDDLDRASTRVRTTLSRLKILISEEFRDSAFDLGMAATALGVSTRTLQHHLALSEARFSDILRRYRLEWARLEIARRSASVSIESIALECGFVDVSSFYRAFRRRYGIAPGQVMRR